LLAALSAPMRSKQLAVVLIIAGIAIYTVFVGASPSVVRAAIMGTLAVIAQRVGRKGDGLTALAVSVWVMTAINPYWLLDLGLILSATATLGLILFSQPLAHLARRIANRLFAETTARKIVEILSDAVLIALAAQIMTLPIIFLMFGRFSVVSFLANILIIPAQASIMVLGILALSLGALLLPAGQLFAWLVGIPLAYTLAIIKALAQLPGASVPVTFEPGPFVLTYLGIIGVAILISQPTETRQSLKALFGKTVTVPVVSLLGTAIAVLFRAVVGNGYFASRWQTACVVSSSW
jgi:competence protein ComEC